uniref:Uncharacterized protein n=1 Tax=Plectus sambesii TaxID=2011161 RepID=A0A914XTU0_9BILA
MEARSEEIGVGDDCDFTIAEKMKPNIDKDTRADQSYLCDNITATQKSFNSHRRQKHGIVRNTLICSVDSCTKSPLANALKMYLKSMHCVNEEIEKSSFESKDEFMTQKEDLQKKPNSIHIACCFTKSSSPVTISCAWNFLENSCG